MNIYVILEPDTEVFHGVWTDLAGATEYAEGCGYIVRRIDMTLALATAK